MEVRNGKLERKTRMYQMVVSKLAYLEARRVAEKHSVWWSKVRVTETGDPIDGMVLIEFRGREDKKDLIEKDFDYVNRLQDQVATIYDLGKRQMAYSIGFFYISNYIDNPREIVNSANQHLCHYILVEWWGVL